MDLILEQINNFFTTVTNLNWTRPYLLWLIIPAIPITYHLVKKILSVNAWSSWIKEPMLSLLVKKNGKSKNITWALALFFIASIFALSGPATYKESKNLNKSTIPLFIMMDLSLSMNSEDISPNRLEYTKYKITDILKSQKDGLASLVIYSGSAHTVTPLTQDIETILNQLVLLEPEIMPEYGSNPIKAINLIVKSILELGSPKGKIIWFTDQASTMEINEISQKAEQNNQKLVIVMIGTEKGSVIPLKTGIVYDVLGQPALSKTPIKISKLVSVKNGDDFYIGKQLTPSLISRLANQNNSEKTKKIKSEKSSSQRSHEWGYLFAIPLLLLLIPIMRANILSLLLIKAVYFTTIINILSVNSVQASWVNWWKTSDQQASDLYQNKQYKEAASTFKNLPWKSASLYQSKEFASAEKIYEYLKDYYNLGNSLANQGKFPEAIKAYEQTLKNNSNHKDAKFNLEVLQSLLKENPKKNSEKQKGDSKDQKKSENDQQSKDQQENDQNSQKLDQDKSYLDNKESEEQKKKNKQNEEQSKKESNQQNPKEEKKQQDKSEQSTKEKKQQKEFTEKEKKQQKELTQKQIKDREQAIEYKQWLRKLPSNPSLLLKRKFDYQHKQSKNLDNNDQSNNQQW